MSGTIKIEKDKYLFREGDPPDAMYVVKSGKFAVVKPKANQEIILAEIGPGTMVGEMAFFDQQPRSASLKALKDSEVIPLPYKSLHQQFSKFPEWAKAIMKQVSKNLRTANARIKQLEKGGSADEELFPSHSVTKLTSILNFVGHKYGQKTEEGLQVPSGTLRNFTIQVFQEPTNKMQKLIEAYSSLGFTKLEDLGEGRQKLLVLKPDILFGFAEWYNEWNFKKESDRFTVTELELKVLKALVTFMPGLEKNPKGQIKINLSSIQNESQAKMGYLVKVEEFDSLVQKKILADKIMQQDGIYTLFFPEEIEKLVPYWEIIYHLKKFK